MLPDRFLHNYERAGVMDRSVTAFCPFAKQMLSHCD
jgi:hypothetical protein